MILSAFLWSCISWVVLSALKYAYAAADGVPGSNVLWLARFLAAGWHLVNLARLVVLILSWVVENL